MLNHLYLNLAILGPIQYGGYIMLYPHITGGTKKMGNNKNI